MVNEKWVRILVCFLEERFFFFGFVVRLGARFGVVVVILRFRRRSYLSRKFIYRGGFLCVVFCFFYFLVFSVRRILRVLGEC